MRINLQILFNRVDRNLKKRGFEKSSRALDQIMAKSIKKRGFLHYGLFVRWREIIGPELSDKAMPLKLSSKNLKNGSTLTLQINGSYGPEIQLMLESIRDKINEIYGYKAVDRIKLVQLNNFGRLNQDALKRSDNINNERKNLKDILDHRVVKNINNIKNSELRAQLMLLGKNIVIKK